MARMNKASRKQTLFVRIRGHSPSPTPYMVQSKKPETVKPYVVGEIELVSLLLTMRQACGTKLIIEHKAASAPATVIQFTDKLPQ